MALFTVKTSSGDVKVEGGFAHIQGDTLSIMSQNPYGNDRDPLAQGRGVLGGLIAAFAPGHWTQVTQESANEGVKK